MKPTRSLLGRPCRSFTFVLVVCAIGGVQATSLAQDNWPATTDDPLGVPRGIVTDEHLQLMLTVAKQKAEATIVEFETEMDTLESRLAEEKVQLARLSDLWEQREQRIQAMGFESDSILPNIVRLEQQRLQLAVDLAGKSARYRAALEQVEKLKQERDAAAQEDVILEHLHSLLTLEKSELVRLRELVMQQVVSQGELTKAVARVAELEIRVATREEIIKGAASEPRIAALSDELFVLSLDVAELEAKQERISEQLARLKEARNETASFDTLRGMRAALPGRLIELQFRIDDLRTQSLLEKVRVQRLNVRLDELDLDESNDNDQ